MQNTHQIQKIIDYAMTAQSPWGRSAALPTWGVHRADPAPWNQLFGPVSDHAGPNGAVWKNGECVVSWGDIDRPELTFSVAKTYLALLAGVAFDRGLIAGLDTPVFDNLPNGTAKLGFSSDHNRAVTWRHLLQQTSEWEGECFGISEQADRNRYVQYQPNKPLGNKGEARLLHAPGSYWEYNDVRINQLSRALLHLFAKPLPEVFEETIMRPLGASATWTWLPYYHAYDAVNGQMMPSVPGGSHWGGGVSISSRDQGLVGSMLLHRGHAGAQGQGQPVLSETWLSMMTEASPLADFYGMLVWLNKTGKLFPSASRQSWYAVGAGTSITGIDPEHNTVVVARWIDGEKVDGLLALVRGLS